MRADVLVNLRGIENRNERERKNFQLLLLPFDAAPHRGPSSATTWLAHPTRLEYTLGVAERTTSMVKIEDVLIPSS